MKEVLTKCARCKEENECLSLSLDDNIVMLCSYCMEQVKIHGKIIPPVVIKVKKRICNKCAKILWPHEYFYYKQDWEDISKSEGYFCQECCKEHYPIDLKTVWTACKVYEHTIEID
jgi:hypothetical protein